MPANIRSLAVGTLVMLLAVARTRAAETFVAVPLERLTFADNAKLPDWPGGRHYSTVAGAMRPRVAIRPPADVEAYVVGNTSGDQPRWQTAAVPLAQMRLVIRDSRAERSGPVSGTLYFPNDDMTGMKSLAFAFEPSKFSATREDFLRAKVTHYELLRASGPAGAAWFRRQERDARRELGGAATREVADLNVWPRGAAGRLDDTFGLFTGGRAVSENLQLDRALPPSRQPEKADVNLDSLHGITVAAMDWAALIAQNPEPQLDPLAALVPADQHAVFFPSFSAAVTLVDQMQRQGSIVPSLADESRSEDAASQQRYERQLCLSLTGLGRLLGPTVVKSVAVTGSDAYLRVGSDVAVLFEPANETAVAALIAAQVELARKSNPAAEAISGEINGVAYRGARSPDRSICSYVSTLAGMVVVTNSPAQLKRIIETQAGKMPALAAAPEYAFFRQRYSRTDANETALIVLSDATIRRWCGPKWRIADSRRTRAAAAMADLQAAHARDVIAGSSADARLTSEFAVPELDEMRLTRGDGITSPVYGTLAFMTPITELEFSTVTQNEADSYGRWRDTYQQNWSWAFDPIALRVCVEGKKISTDLTVTPLIVRTEYSQLIELSRGATLTAASGDPHPEAVAQAALAINPKSNTLKAWGSFMQTMSGNLRIEPLAWVGNSASLFADDDPYWQQLAQEKDADKFMSAHWSNLPIGLFVESASPMKLAAFLTAVRAYADQSAPGLLRWETLNHGEQPYVKVTAAPGHEAQDEGTHFDVFYASMPDALVLSLNEDIVKRAIDRRRAGGAASTRPSATTMPTTQPWLGNSLCFQLQPRLADVFATVAKKDSEQQAQSQAWSNLEILNEWMRLFPDRDPVEVHQRLFGTRLIDPAGTSYIWNARWQTMESQTYGHPGEPKTGPSASDALRGLKANVGLTFENNGLRVRAEIDRP